MGYFDGGLLINRILANDPGVFKASVSENPVADLLVEWASSDFGWVLGRRAINVPNPWDDITAWLARSPSTRMHQNHAPPLLRQAANHIRYPPGNTQTTFTSLRTLARRA